MKQIFLFALAFVAVINQGESSALKSSIKNEIVQILGDANNLVSQISNQANDYFIEKLTNETQIQEWSVTIQAEVVTGLTELGFGVFNAYKDYVINKYGSDQEKKVLTCIGNEESPLVASLGDAASQNGWCNNRLAANLTRAFQATSQQLVNLSDEVGDDITTLSSCILGDDICLGAFIVKVVALAQSALIPTGDTLLTGLQDVLRVYSIMFGQDVPRCNNEYLFPLLLQGVGSAVTDISTCILS